MCPIIELPPIVIPSDDYGRLAWLATASMMGPRRCKVGERLADELVRASVVPARDVPPVVVTMNSEVIFREPSGRVSSARIVYPEEADPRAGRISVLTEVGTALLGLSEGQSIRWRPSDGSFQEFAVLGVIQLSPRNAAAS